MTLNTFKWIYQRISTPLIIILSLMLFLKAYKIESYDYENIYFFFKNKNNLFLFIILILLSSYHTSIEVFHSIHDYFYKSKNENTIKYFIIILYILVLISFLIFISKFIF
tara:strand:- start:7054 stop:7383 length:330 start_codon:yes stop_codon:yes gene_type:complete